MSIHNSYLREAFSQLKRVYGRDKISAVVPKSGQVILYAIITKIFLFHFDAPAIIKVFARISTRSAIQSDKLK
jgi:hypothetical protein